MNQAALQVHEGGADQVPARRQRQNIALSSAGSLVFSGTDDILEFARMAMVSGLYPATANANAAVQATKIQFIILYGLELQLTPMQSLQGIVLVDGKISLMANIVSMLLDRNRKRIRYKAKTWTNEACVIVWTLDDEVIGESSFDMADARRAGLTSKGVWSKYPKSMLWARALTQGARAYATFVFGGGVYTPEELGDDDERYVDLETSGEKAQVVEERRPQPHRNPGGSDKLRAQATAKKAEKVQDAEVVAAEEPVAARAPETVVVPDPAGAAPADDVPVVQAEPEVLPPVEGGEFSGALKAALGATPPRDKRSIAIMGAFLKEWLGKLDREEAGHLKLWARAMNNELQGKPLEAGLPAGAGDVLARLQRAVPVAA